MNEILRPPVRLIGWNFSDHGLYLNVKQYNFSHKFVMRDDAVITYEGQAYAIANFVPDGTQHFDSKKLTHFVAELFKGLEKFFNEYDQIDNESPRLKPLYIAGIANERMARFAQDRMGFKRVKKTIEGEDCNIIATTAEVREKYFRLAASETIRRLNKRESVSPYNNVAAE